MLQLYQKYADSLNAQAHMSSSNTWQENCFSNLSLAQLKSSNKKTSDLTQFRNEAILEKFPLL